MRTTPTFTHARRLLWALLLPLLLLGACDTKTDSQKELEELIEKQKVKDDELIKTYLTTNNISNAERTSTGLYIIRTNTPGTGPSPVMGSQVKTKYIGRKLSTGLRFDASIDNGTICGCTVFAVGGVIEGWNEALMTMHKGDKVTLIIPSHLAYGARGTGVGGNIGPFEVLIFDMELLDFQ